MSLCNTEVILVSFFFLFFSLFVSINPDPLVFLHQSAGWNFECLLSAGSVLCQGGSRGPWLTVKRETVFSLRELVVCGKNYRRGQQTF